MRNVTLLLLVPLFSLFAAPAFPQSTAPVWERFYGSGAANPEDRATDAATDAGGNLYVTGSSTVTETYADFLTVKFDTEGDVLWSARYDGEGFDDEARAIAVDAEGNVYITGSSQSRESEPGVATLKYDRDGKLLWKQRLEGVVGLGRLVALGANGLVYISATIYDEPDHNCTLVAYDVNGLQRWIVPYRSRVSACDVMEIDEKGNVYTTRDIEEDGKQYVVTSKHDDQGQKRWDVRYDPGESLRDLAAEALAVDADGNVYIAGLRHTQDYVSGALIMKYDASGQHLWTRFDDRLGYAHTIALDEASGVYVGGSSIKWPYRAVVAKYSAEGDLLWGSVTPEFDHLVYLGEMVVSGSEVYLTGAPYGEDVITMAYDADSGSLNWTTSYASYPADVQKSYLALTQDRVYTVSRRPSPSGDTDFLIASHDREGHNERQFTYNADGKGDVETGPVSVTDEQGATILAMTSRSATTGADYLVQKYAADGTLLWTTRYDEAGDETLSDLATDASGNIYLAGAFRSDEATGYLTMKLAPDGKRVWSRQHPLHDGRDDGYAYYEPLIAVDARGHVLVTGDDGESTSQTLRYDVGGNRLWLTVEPGYPGYRKRGLGLDASGNAYVLRDSESSVAKYAADDGRRLWTAEFDDVSLATLAVTSSGEVYWAAEDRAGGGACRISKLNRDGTPGWEMTGAAGFDGTPQIALDHEGQVIAVCRATVAKYDPDDGRRVWTQTLDEQDLLDLDVATSADGRITVGSPSFLPNVVKLFVLDKDGSLTWSTSYTLDDEPGGFSPRTLGVDDEGDIYVSAVQRGAGWSRIGLLKFAPGASVPVEEAPPMPTALTLDQNHPNPFSAATEIEYALPAPADVRLDVYDLLGRKVATLAEGGRPAGTHRAVFNADGRLASGVYFYRLEAGNQVQTRQMVVAR